MKKILLFLFLTFWLLAGCDKAAQEEVIDKPLPSGNFQSYESKWGIDYNAGTVYVRGYSTIRRVKTSFCDENGMNESGTEPCKEFDYVLLHITESGETPDFDKYLPKEDPYEGGHFFDTSSIGLGCLFGGNIVYSNDTDEYEIVNAPIGARLTKKILGSTKETPVVLILTKNPNTLGRGAPACYSHITTIEEYLE